MPTRPTALTGAAGEHFVAYKLSAMGFPVALTRGGSPSVDLMVGALSGKNAISIQVKTSDWAYRQRKRKPEDSHWEWDVGKKGLCLNSESIFYTFIDLKWNCDDPQLPDVFIVPSADVKRFLKPEWSRYMFWIYERDRNKYLEAWHLLTAKLK